MNRRTPSRSAAASFQSVADQYDAARPDHPAGVFDALGPLDGLQVLDVGAGTGIATRALIARGATVVAVDTGLPVLHRAVARSPGLTAVVADGAVLPVRTGVVDLLCFGQSWHWLDATTRVAEAHRVLRPQGRWAGWWSHARADGERWFDRCWDAIERTNPSAHRSHRDIDWGATIATEGTFDVGARITVPWVRQLPVEAWLTDQESHSYVAVLREGERVQLLGEVRAILDAEFPDGAMSVPYETWLWVATRR